MESEVLKDMNNLDEVKLFMDTIEKIKQSINVNLLTTVYDSLPKSSKDYLERCISGNSRNVNSF
jgi:hypothetical protein